MALLDENSYQKGAWVLHMLHTMLGDSIFFAGIRSYYAQYRNSTALTDDLEKEFERGSQQNLRWFFDEWLRRPGYITLTTDWSYFRDSHHVEISVHQTGPFLPYRFLLTVESISQEGQRYREQFLVRATETNVFRLQHAFKDRPTTIRIDPNAELLAKIVEHSSQ
jgi:aminopeptidase N